MAVVAIAGGTSIGLGRAIVTAILSIYPNGEWTPLILSRSSKQPLWLRAIDPELRRVQLKAVDYTSHDDLVATLSGVHTLLSVVLAKDGTQAQSQISLLNAAVDAGVKRFAPSEWANGPVCSRQVQLMDWARIGVWEACDVAEREGKIDCWTRFNCGGFMNYFGIGRYEDVEDEGAKLKLMEDGNGYAKGDDEVCAGVDKEGDMADGTGAFLFSLSTATAELAVAEDGAPSKMSLTELRDVGRFAARALALPTWEQDMNIVGDTVTTDEALTLAEAVTGKKFEVKKLTPSELQKQIAALAPHQMMERLWLDLKLQQGIGNAALPATSIRLVPELKPTSLSSYLHKYWA